MTQPKLDGAGAAKWDLLQEGLAGMTRVHGIVEQMALSVKRGEGAGKDVQRLKRAVTPLIGMLKGQYGAIADVLSAMLLAATRGGGDQTRLRVLRESVASVRFQLDAALTRVVEQHGEKEKKGNER
jgi:hypothetical protein